MMKFQTEGLEGYLTDPVAEATTGVWLAFPNGWRFLCLRAGGANRAYQRAASAALKPHRQQIQRGTMDPEKLDEIVTTLYVNHVVKDIDGVKDEEGNPVPYSKKAVREILNQFPEMFAEIQNRVQDPGTFYDQDAEEAKEVLGEL
jgi:hypothetical protein